MIANMDHEQAWKTVDGFVDTCKEQYARNVVAIILTGSLAGGSYQPGLSDVDLLTVLGDRSPDRVRDSISSLCRRMSSDYSTQLDPIILEHSDFWPPWNDSLCIQPELLRLKAGARVLYGQNIVEHLPTPTKRQMWEFDRSFREWLTQSNQPNWRYWSLKESLKTIFGQAMTYFYYKTGIAEYSKHHIADLFSRHFPHFCHLSTLSFASYLWKHYPGSTDEGLRIQMAEQARDVHNYVTLALGFGEKYLIQ
ncbi:nucleotidyltransferase domain-containing protein [Candidatus Poribacteria bacterium]